MCDSDVCSCKKNIYHSRIRVIAHVQNPLKPECNIVILSGAVATLTVQDLQRLDASDAADIHAARKLGLSYPKAINAAMSKDGKRLGCARA